MNSDGAGIVFLHALARTPRSFNKMQKTAEACGFRTLNLSYASRTKTLEALADDIHEEVERFCREATGSIHFVGHSMGGLLARVYLSKYRPVRLGRVVLIGTPNSGSEVADALGRFWIYRTLFGPAGLQLGTAYSRTDINPRYPPTYPVGIVAGNRTVDPVSWWLFLPRPNDGKVSVENTKLVGMTDHIVIGTAHALLASNSEAIKQTIAFLREGRFAA
jgi:pimeloyl-ACP methyl ester carboxylesterase